MTGAELKRAKSLLAEGGWTCVLCREGEILTSRERGVAPLLSWLDGGSDLSGFSAADKVVGKAAAFLYVLLGVKEVYAPVMSQPAWDTLEKQGIPPSCDTLAPAIRNRAGTGFCPMETAVREIDDPAEALAAIRAKRTELMG